MKKYIILFLLILGIAFLIAIPFVVKVNAICKSQYGACSDDMNKKITAVSGQSLFKANISIKKILISDGTVADLSTQFKLPNTILVNLLIKRPNFALINTDASKVALIESEGRVLAISDSTNLPKVQITGNLPKVGDNVGQRELTALKLISGVFEMYQVGSGVVQDTSLVVDLPGQIRVLFPLDASDPQVLLGALRLIYTRITSAEMAGKYSQIDLRFKNPVLR